MATVASAAAPGATVAPRRASAPPTVGLLGHRIACLDLERTAAFCRDAVLRRERVHQVSLNAAKVVAARDDRRLREILDAADLVSADGQALVWASRLLGTPLPERVAGIDLMLRLLELAEAGGLRVYFLGARDDVLARAVARLRSRHPRLVVAGTHHGYFDVREDDAVVEAIEAARPDLLFVAMSSPRKEYWTSEHGPLLEVPVIVGVGGALDVLAGDRRRAPRPVQSAGLEWAWRLVQEPRRLWRRYLTTNIRFLLIVGAALVRSRLP